MVELPKTDWINDRIVIDFVSFPMHFVMEFHDIYNVAYHIYMLVRQSGVQCLCCYIDDDYASICMFHNLSEYIKHGSLQIKRNNLVPFLHLQIFVPVRIKTRTFYGHHHSL